MITIYLIRHGETLWNKKGRYQGIADVELSEKGILQADKIEDYFRDIKLMKVLFNYQGEIMGYGNAFSCSDSSF